MVIYMKKFISFFLALTICLSATIACFALEENAQIDDFSKSSILICADTGDIIYEKNAYEHLSPASVTKIMSILLVLEAIESGKISLEDEVSASESAVEMGGSQIWLEVGEKMSVNDLFKAVVVASANDACTALGEYIAGSPQAFVTMMNEKAEQLGLKNTNFENCTGLDDTVTNHYSCAYDLAIIAKEVLKYDLIYDYTTIWLDYLRGGKTELNNTNKLINKYNGITGLKTGTTSKAGFCVCATATQNGMTLIAVVLGAKTSDERFQSASNLLDYGFANYEVIAPEIDINQITSVKVRNGVEKEIIPVYNQTDKLMIKKGNGDITYEYKTEEEVKAPVAENQTLGEICIYSNGALIKSVKLYSSKEIMKINFNYIFKEMLRNI